MPGRIAQKADRRVGDVIYLSKVLTSSNILNSAATDLSTPVLGGDLLVTGVTLATDSTGLAGGTNFEISVSGETYGIDKPIVETVANLGASALRKAGFAIPAYTTNDNGLTVTNGVPFVLQEGDKLQFGSSVADCTGAGKILVVIELRRITPQANIAAA